MTTDVSPCGLLFFRGHYRISCLIKIGQNKYITRLNDLHVKGLRIIDCNKHDTDAVLEKEYGLLMPIVHRHEHHSAIMYRQCRVVENLKVSDDLEKQ